MAKELILQIAINAAGGVQSLAELQKHVQLLKKEISGKPIGSKDFNDLTEKISESNKAIRTINQSFKSIDAGSAAGSIGEIKQQIKDLTLALNDVEVGSPIAKKLEADLSVAKGELAEFKQRTKGLSGDELASSFAKFGQGVAGSFGIAMNALNVFGAKNESVKAAQEKAEKAIAVVVSAKAVAEGIESGVKLVSIAQTRLYTTLVGLESAAQSQNIAVRIAATIAQRALNAAMYANPIMLVVGALITLGGALAYFSSATDEATDKQNAINAAKEDGAKRDKVYSEAFQKVIDARQNGYNREIALAKAKGATDEEISKLTRKKYKDEEGLIMALISTGTELSTAQNEQLKNLRNQLDILDAEDEKRKEDKLKKDKEAGQKQAEEQRKILEQINQVRASLITDGLQREITIEKANLSEKLAAIKGNGILENQLREELRKQSNQKIEKLVEDNVQKLAELNDKLNLAEAGGNPLAQFEAKANALQSKIDRLKSDLDAEQARVNQVQSGGGTPDLTNLTSLKGELISSQNELETLSNNFKKTQLDNLATITEAAINGGRDQINIRISQLQNLLTAERANYNSRKQQLEEEIADQNLPVKVRQESQEKLDQLNKDSLKKQGDYYTQLGILSESLLSIDDAQYDLKKQRILDAQQFEIDQANATGEELLAIKAKYQLQIDALGKTPEQKAEERQSNLDIDAQYGELDFQNKIAALEREKQAILDSTTLTEQQKKDKIEAFSKLIIQLKSDEEKTKLQITADAFQTLSGLMKQGGAAAKSFAIASATINTYLAATDFLAKDPNPYTKIIGMIAIIGAGLAQVIKISGVQFAKGGVVDMAGGGMLDNPGLPGTSTSDSIPARLSKGESVINARSTSMYKPILSAINAAGGGVAFSRGGYIPQMAAGGIAPSSTLLQTVGSAKNDTGVLQGMVQELKEQKQNPAPVYVVSTEVTDVQRRDALIENRTTW